LRLRMNKPYTAQEEYLSTVFGLGEMVYYLRPGAAESCALLCGEDWSAGVFPSFGILCRTLGLEPPEAMCAALCLYHDASPVPPLTADGLLEQYRRLAKRPPGAAFRRLFITDGERAALHPIAADFLLGERLRFPAGIRLLPPDVSENPPGKFLPPDASENPPGKLFEELFGLVSEYTPDARPLVIALDGNLGNLFSKVAGAAGSALLTADISKTPDIEDVFLAAEIYGCMICLEGVTDWGILSETASRAGIVFVALTGGESIPQRAEYTLFTRKMPKTVPAGGTGSLNSLIIPPEQARQLRELCSFIANRGTVYEKWGKQLSWGRGISILFYGAPGTGKTMAASILADETGLPLMKADISQLISKYIGETQKNIGRIFDEASGSDCILFFDEADALFTRRSEASDAQDKYANAETAYLLQRMERHDGVCILATNLLQNFDEAFRRRLGYMLNFPMPDGEMRERIWRGIFGVSVEGLDYSFLARHLELSGASIKNCAVHAAYLAAVNDTDISMKYILAGARNEYAKLGRSFSPQIFKGFFEEVLT
jgi:DNA polymerase III delta prime subunit